MTNLKDELSWLLNSGFLRWLIIGTTITFVLVYLVSSPIVIKPVYQAESVIFIPLTLFNKQFDQQGIGFGSQAEIDGHIQILQSTRILDSLDKRFGLLAQLTSEIDYEYARSLFYKNMRSKIKIVKTRYGSVSVAVQDQDAAKAAELANAIVALGDIIKQDILLENRIIAVDFARDLYEKKEQDITLLEDKINVTGIENSLTDLRTLNIRRQQTIYEAELYELTALKNNYEKLLKSLDIDLPKVYVISPAIKAHRPEWPPRLLFSAVAALIYIVLLFFITLSRRELQ
jgi:capsular polysaccharide biosynthesis protein